MPDISYNAQFGEHGLEVTKARRKLCAAGGAGHSGRLWKSGKTVSRLIDGRQLLMRAATVFSPLSSARP
jgi:hypothetical protein